jgi:hypothetical protein
VPRQGEFVPCPPDSLCETCNHPMGRHWTVSFGCRDCPCAKWERPAWRADGPYFVTMNTDPPKPPYGTPERAAMDEAGR